MTRERAGSVFARIAEVEAMTMEEKVRKRYMQAVRQFVKTDNERFLHHMEVLSEVLGLTPLEELGSVEQAMKEVGKEVSA